MEVGNQLQLPPSPDRFTDGKEPRYPLNWGLRGAPELILAIWRREKSLSLVGFDPWTVCSVV
jgi:hypothetical protein